MLPPDGRGMGHQMVRRGLAGCGEMGQSVAHVVGIPVDDRRNHEIEAGCPIELRLMAAVDDPPLPECADGLGQGMALSVAKTVDLFRDGNP